MVLYCYDGHFANQNSPQLPAHIYCYKSCEAQGKNVLLHLENLMLNGWNVLKWGEKKKETIILWCIWSSSSAVQTRHYPESCESQNGGFRGNKTNSYFSHFKKMLVLSQHLKTRIRTLQNQTLYYYFLSRSSDGSLGALSLLSLFIIPSVSLCYSNFCYPSSRFLFGFLLNCEMDLCLILAFSPLLRLFYFLISCYSDDFLHVSLSSIGNCTSALGICSISFMNTEEGNSFFFFLAEAESIVFKLLSLP